MPARISAVVVLVLLYACGPVQTGASEPTANQPISDQEATALLAKRLETDPNGAMCTSIVTRLNRHDIDALKEFVDPLAVAERAIAAASMRDERATSWRDHAASIENLWQITVPNDTRFFCLGTFDDPGGAKILMLRARRPSDFYHLLLRLGGPTDRPVDDYMLTNSGYWHSALQSAFDDDNARPFGDIRSWMFQASYEEKFEEIITKYDALPDRWKTSPFFFREYINAVMTVTPTAEEASSERFIALKDGIHRAFDHPAARAYWLLFYYARLGDTRQAEEQITTLSEPYQDPIASDMRTWIDQRRSPGAAH